MKLLTGALIALVGLICPLFVQARTANYIEQALIKNNVKLDKFRETRADASEYFDMVLANLRDQMFMLGLNAMPLPDQVLEFEQEIGGIVWHGTAALFNGTLSNMDTIHRTGVAELVVEENGDMVISADVGVNKGTLHYEMLAKFMDLGPHAIVDGTLSKVRIYMSLRVSLADLKVVLEKFDIKNTGILSVDIKGLGAILNFLVGIVADFLGNLIKGIVVALIEGPIMNLINQIIENILFPPEGVFALQAAQNLILSAIV